ncbi:DNA-binding transcriptional regulator, AcrR family [Parafrankia irregularis]|uniref:DNA-binding transcriptional regulator, AcrR family n=1 Tax=Parafrankia irregularis TaxID=795642 RepID=A0A0S4QH89_9ACTN|nr:TetR/AcrR family transcriptional regulator [Parafrankia irregularis]MBE3200762.1 TetR/AcrR family transcriptional regulator [Parafrankia sp. CH37]CUU54852.1 DNA-binding transcriptional regulator, AcrR family [Parafrankia irregularis]
MAEAEGSAPTTDRRGRPRRFDEGTERQMIMDAAVRLMKGSGHAEMAVVDVLAGTGLSTRAFYRHFGSKEALLLALIHREAEAVARSMTRAVERAREPAAALEAWLDRLLDTFFEPRQVARSALFTTAAAGAAVPLAEKLDDIRWILARPLADVLRAGNDAGVLFSPNPDADAISLFGLVGAASHSAHANLEGRPAVRAQVIRFAWPAFGLPAATNTADDASAQRGTTQH